MKALIGIGFSSLELKERNINTNTYDVTFLYTKKINDIYSVEAGLGWMSNQGGDLTMQTISVPIILKTFFLGKENAIYNGFIIKPVYNYNLRVEENVDHLLTVSKGGNLLIGAKIGTDININADFAFTIELNILGDVGQFGYKEEKALKFDNLAFLSLGLRF